MNIHYIKLDKIEYADVRGYASLLPAERQEKISRFRFEEDKLRSLAAGLLIRRVTGDKKLSFGAHGKPYLDGGSMFFSASHSGDIAAIAYDEADIGLDVEQLPDENRLKIADRFFHPNERRYVNGAQNKPLAFCEIWTRKEAYLKRTGEGISTDLTAFDTTSEPLKSRIITIELEGYCLTVCSENPIDEKDVYISEIELTDLIR